MKSDLAKNVPNALETIIQLRNQREGLDITYDELRLIGSVVGLITLLQVATYSGDAKARTSAARILVDLKEEPSDIVERLKAAPFADLSANQLAFVIDQMATGRTDLDKLYEEARELEG
jgi:hypothetical protein